MTKSFAWVSLALAASCASEDPVRILVHDQAEVPDYLYVDSSGAPFNRLTPANEGVFKVADGVAYPVMAPTGALMTWGEFGGAAGTLRLECTDDGTIVDADAEGLIPGGTYSTWVYQFQAPGFDQAGLDALVAVSAAGEIDGSEAVFKADGIGHGGLAAVAHQGPVGLGLIGVPVTPTCLLDAYEVHVVLTYAIDGATCGKLPCAERVRAEQAEWMIKGGEARVRIRGAGPVDRRPRTTRSPYLRDVAY